MGLVLSVVSVVVLMVASGTTLFPEVFSGNKFCVTSGNLGTGQVFVASVAVTVVEVMAYLAD